MQETSLEVHNKHFKKDGGYSCTAYSDIPVGNKGSVFLEVCEKCSYILVVCNHDNNDWNEEGTVLKCRLCGLDGT